MTDSVQCLTGLLRNSSVGRTACVIRHQLQLQASKWGRFIGGAIPFHGRGRFMTRGASFMTSHYPPVGVSISGGGGLWEGAAPAPLALILPLAWEVVVTSETFNAVYSGT